MSMFCKHDWILDCEKEKNDLFCMLYHIRIYICKKCGKIKKVEI